VYHAIFRSRLLRAFRDLNEGNYDKIVAQFSPALEEHTFYGDHALGGTRRTLDATRAWYGRLARLLPDLKFEITQVAVRGWPWDTFAVVEWHDHFTVDGKPVSNHGVHAFRFRWGRCVALRVHCDTQKLADALRRLAAAGNAEAMSPPIESAPAGAGRAANIAPSAAADAPSR
jgi:ketosteroid isomerase-like protein